MWIVTNFGFFSVVQKPGDDQLTVRARVRQDLEALRGKYIPDLGEILENAGTDYQYRVKVRREVFAEAMKSIVLDIDYSNFKNSVAKKQGHNRAHVYHDLWSSLWRISEEE
ncbi:MAG: hypothetical protein M1423_01935 [Acidobacteria bacterium]|nr:hypothetical protein [Acidobacteriota bacterium]